MPERGTEQRPIFWAYVLAAALQKPDARICAFGKFSRREESAEHWHTLWMGGDITFLGRVDYRNDGRRFGIKREDRFAHVYVIGKTGTGKSTLLETLIRQDIEQGSGVAVIDPHGDLCEELLNFIPETRVQDTIYFNAADRTSPMGEDIRGLRISDLAQDTRRMRLQLSNPNELLGHGGAPGTFRM